MPNYTDREVYFGRVRYEKKFLWFLRATHTLTQRHKDAPSGSLPYDSFAGGAYDIKTVTGQLPPQFPPSILVNPQYGFIPVVSALDIKRDDQQPVYNDYSRSYAGGQVSYNDLSTEFDNFIVDYNANPYFPANNDHISFQARNGNWFAEELNGGNPMANCSFACNNIEINGPSILCSSPTVFSVPQGGDSYSWVIQNPYAVNILSPTNENSITLSRKGNRNEWIGLEVTVDGGDCGNAVITKDVYVGVPQVVSIEEVSVAQTGHTLPIAPFGSCDEVGLKLNFAPSFANVQDMEWEKLDGTYTWSQGMPGNSNQYVVIAPVCNETISFRVRMLNNCGWSDWQTLFYEVTHCSSNCSTSGGGGTITSDYFVIYPIPADTSLHVNLIGSDPTDLLLAGESLAFQLFDSTGKIVEDIPQTLSCQNIIDVSNLPAGNYILKIIYNGVPESHQVVIG